MVKIKTILTALGNPEFQEKIKSDEIEIKSFDIQYKEGILEYLEEESNIDFIIISEELPGDIELQDLIQKIHKINEKIKIIFYSKNKENSAIEGVFERVYNLDEDSIEKIKYEITGKKLRKTKTEAKPKIEKITKEKSKVEKINGIEVNENKFSYVNLFNKESKINHKESKLKKEDKKIKNSLFNKTETSNNSKSTNTSETIYKKATIPKNEIIEPKEREGKIVSIAGTSGIGKSTFSILFAQNAKKSKKLIIDFDLINNNLHTILGINLYPEKLKKEIKANLNKLNYDYIDINDFIVNTKYGVDIISGLNLIFNSEKQSSPSKIRNLIKQIKSKYDLIVIDTSSYGLLDYTKELFKISDKIIFISGANTLEVKKSQGLLKIYKTEWRIDTKKTDIIFNKYSEKSLDEQVLRNLFKSYNVLGTIKLRDYYDFMINHKTSVLGQINKELDRIQKNLDRTDELLAKLK